MLSKIRTIIAAVGTVVIITLGTTVAILGAKLRSTNQSLSYSRANEAALLLAQDSDKNQIRSLQLSVEQLEYFNDSVIRKLEKAYKDLRVKDKNLKELQYLKTIAHKTDTLLIRDTVLVEGAYLDTVIGDKWYSLHLSVCYPNELVVSPTFVSEKSIVTSLKKETINPPKKCRLARAFQKKHKVVIVDIKEENPYIETTDYQHITVVK